MKVKTAIIIDSSAGISELNAHPDVYQVDLSIIKSNDEVLDDLHNESEIGKFYQFLRQEKELPTTSQPAPAEFLQILDEMKRVGYDQVIGLFLADALSGTAQTCRLLLEGYQEDFESLVIDTAGASIKIQYMVDQTLKALEQGFNLEEIQAVLVRIAQEANIYLMVDSLNNLAKGGRIGTASAVIGTALSIKPILKIGSEGSIELFDKVRTKKKALNRMIDQVLLEAKKYGSDFDIGIAHTGAEKEVEYVCNAIQEQLASPVSFKIAWLTPVIGIHTGTGALGMMVLPHRPEEM
ncbi:DegV family protein [Hutsoniella sourekii]